MSKIIFWDVDTQVDFMKSDGKLYVPEAEEIIPNLEKLIKHARHENIPIFGSVDYHSMEDSEIHKSDFNYKNTFPPHCLAGTIGQEKIEATKPLNPLWIDIKKYPDSKLKSMLYEHKGEVIIRKQHFDVFTNPNTETILNIVKPNIIVVFGVALDVCNAHAINGFIKRGGVEIFLVTDGVKSINKEKSDQLISEWKGKGVKMITTNEIVERGMLKDRIIKL